MRNKKGVAHMYEGGINYLWVTGNGSIMVAPDIAVMTFGAVTNDKQLGVAQRNNARVIEASLERLKNRGVEEEQIQTVDYTIFPSYDYVDGRREFQGYEVTHLLRVSIDDIARVGELIDEVTPSGINRVESIRFDRKDRGKYEREALKRALKDAQWKAKALTEPLPVYFYSVPVQIIEEQNGDEHPRPLSAGLSAAATPIEAGQMEINASVRAQFAYR
ncbi:DUF541 domain-containing protein [Halobacillus fulvus]|nr:DUF541 domain-containing protein [Halobacillus fulvus]